MNRLTSGMRLGALALALAVLSACSAIYQNHGYVPRTDDLETIVVGEDTRESVGEKIGRPSSAGILAESGWYYVGSRWKQSGPRAPQEIERNVVAISFDAAGVVENVEHFGLEKGQVVVLSRRVTSSNVKGVGFLRQLLGNLGKLSPGQFID